MPLHSNYRTPREICYGIQSVVKPLGSGIVNSVLIWSHPRRICYVLGAAIICGVGPRQVIFLVGTTCNLRLTTYDQWEMAPNWVEEYLQAMA